jgi:predicted PilT family ATPase
VPEKTVPLLIGKAGSNVNTTKAATGCSVSFSKRERSVHGQRKCFHTGPLAEVIKAVAIACGFISEQQGGSSCEVSIVVSHQSAGAVIGKGGENLRSIREMTGCHLSMEKTGEAMPTVGGRCLALKHDSTAQVVLAVYRVCRLQGFASLSAAEDRTNPEPAMGQMGFDPSFAYGPAGGTNHARPTPYGAMVTPPFT